MRLNEVKAGDKMIVFQSLVRDAGYRNAVLKDITYPDNKLKEKFDINVTVWTDGDDVTGVLSYEMKGDPILKNLDVRNGSLEMVATYSVTDGSKQALTKKIKAAYEAVDSDEDLGDLMVKVEELEFSVLASYTVERVKIFTT